MNRLMKCLLIGMFFLPSIVNGQEKPTLTLATSVDYALKHNPELKMAEKEVAKANAGIGEALSGILPQLDASANFRHDWAIQSQTIPNFLKPMLGAMAPPGMPDFVRISFGLENMFTYGVQISQPLFLGGAGIAGIQQAEVQVGMHGHGTLGGLDVDFSVGAEGVGAGTTVALAGVVDIGETADGGAICLGYQWAGEGGGDGPVQSNSSS